MIPRLKPTFGLHELAAALRPGGTGDVARFEAAFAAAMGQAHALAFPHGRTGLMLLLEALGFKNREIICPAYTCVVVPHAIVFSGNTPVFVDCAPGSYTMDLDLAEQAVTERTAAIIPTSLFGYPVDLDRLEAFSGAHPGLALIQDCAHSFDAAWRGRPVQRAGAAALFGLNISKMLSSVFGGMVTTDDAALFQRLKALRDERLHRAGAARGLRRLAYLLATYPAFWGPVYGAVNRLERLGLLARFVRYYDEGAIDMPADHLEALSGLEARVGLANLRRHRDVQQARREAAALYFEQLEDREDFRLPPRVDGATYSHFVVRVPDRERWLRRGLERGVQLGQLIEYNIPEMPAYGGRPPEEFPVAAGYARTTINLPVWGGARVATEVAARLRKVVS